MENVIDKVNDLNEKKRRRKKLSKTASKLLSNVESTVKSLPQSPLIKSRRKGMTRSNFFQKKESESIIKKPGNYDRRKSLFDKGKIIEFLKEEERKKVEKMGIWAKMKIMMSFRARDEDLLKKYFIKGQGVSPPPKNIKEKKKTTK